MDDQRRQQQAIAALRQQRDALLEALEAAPEWPSGNLGRTASTSCGRLTTRRRCCSQIPVAECTSSGRWRWGYD